MTFIYFLNLQKLALKILTYFPMVWLSLVWWVLSSFPNLSGEDIREFYEACRVITYFKNSSLWKLCSAKKDRLNRILENFLNLYKCRDEKCCQLIYCSLCPHCIALKCSNAICVLKVCHWKRYLGYYCEYSILHYTILYTASTFLSIRYSILRLIFLPLLFIF